MDLSDIEIVNAQTCRSVIILSPEGADPDARVIKTILSLVNDPKCKNVTYNIAAEIRDSAYAEIAREVGGSRVQLVLGDDFIAKLIVRSIRQPGLSSVYADLLDFEGCEIYSVAQPKLEGVAFGDALHLYDTCSLIGFCDEAGNVILNPPMHTTMQENCDVLLIAEDDSKIETVAPPDLGQPDHGDVGRVTIGRAERTLLLGWNSRAPRIVRELSRLVEPRSVLTIAAGVPDIDKHVCDLQLVGVNLRVELARIDTCSRAAIDALSPLSYDHILILGYGDVMDAQAADTRTLVTLLYLRAIRETSPERVDVISEIIDVRNVELAELAQVDDLVVSNKLVNRLLTQASENSHF